jgi:hypothetical protein
MTDALFLELESLIGPVKMVDLCKKYLERASTSTETVNNTHSNLPKYSPIVMPSNHVPDAVWETYRRSPIDNMFLLKSILNDTRVIENPRGGHPGY